jgi:hypothetical protein
MRAVRCPVVVFASAGDNITPPGQALRWIADVYRDEQEIKALGQTIVYLMHDEIGHLGIFVSGAVAKKEHSEIASTIELIDSVAPGLYEMVIEPETDASTGNVWHVELKERTIADVRAHGGEAKNEAFPAVAKLSEVNQGLYDVLVAPVVRRMATERSAEARRRLHPMRLRRSLFSDMNPFMAPVAAWARLAREHRAPAAPDNPFRAWERLWADNLERTIDAWRDMRDATTEAAFHAMYGWLAATGIAGEAEAAAARAAAGTAARDIASAPEVRAALARVAEGGYAEAVVRMMILLAQARGGVRRSRLARSSALLQGESPFREMTAEQRAAMIREQTVICTMAAAEALAALPRLLPAEAERRRALAAVEEVAGPEAELGDAAGAMLGQLRATLGLGGGTRPPVPVGFEATAVAHD